MIRSSTSLGSENTPPIIKKMITWIAGITIAIALFNSWPPDFFGLPFLSELFSLSYLGFLKGYLWQPLTYIFVESSLPTSTISLFFLLRLSLDMYFFWILGCGCVEHFGEKKFFKLVLGSTLFIGLVTLVGLSFSSPWIQISGLTPVLFSLLMVWTILHPEARIYLFFLISLKLKTICSVIFIATFLIEFSNQNWIGLLFYSSGVLAGYLFSILSLELKTPFAFMDKIDQFFLGLKDKFRISKKRTKEAVKGKIYDFRTGEEILDDDAFIDAMLAKISRHGESSLTRKERQRMEEISRKKGKKSELNP